MISSPESERRRPLIDYALALSVLIHLLSLVLVGLVPRSLVHPDQQPQELPAVSDVIHIEKRTIPREAHSREQRTAAPERRRLAEQPVVIPTYAPAIVTPTVRPRPMPDERVATSPPAVALTPRHLAQATIHVPAASGGDPSASKPHTGAYSAEQLAQMESQFRSAIAQANTEAREAPSPPARPSALRKYDMIMSGSPEARIIGHGLCDDIQDPWIVGARRWHRLHCNVVYSDGYQESVYVPWPIWFPVNDDPVINHRSFALTQPADANFHLPDVFAVSRLVCQYYRERCEAIFRREQEAGASASAQ